MKTRDYYVGQAERLADRAHFYTYGDGGDPVVGAALAAEGQVYATLAGIAPADRAVHEELDALRAAVAAMLHDADTSADHQAADVIAHFRGELAKSPHGAPVLALLEDLTRDMADQEAEYDAEGGAR